MWPNNPPQSPRMRATTTYSLLLTNPLNLTYLDVFLNNVPVKMELDTGASVSVINEPTYRSIQEQTSALPLQPTETKLRTYTGDSIQVLGMVNIKVRYGEREFVLPAHIVNGGGPNLMGRDWLAEFEVSLSDLKVIHQTEPIDPPAVALTPCKKFYVSTQFSSWAAPIVPVLKKNGKMRVYKITVNQAAPTETYPLPTAEELFARLAGGKSFSKLDLSSAYLQFPLDEASKKYTTINTHKGLFEYNRLPFGVASAPAIFQRHMETLMQGLDMVAVYLDDIIITGTTKEEHLKTLNLVLERLQSAGLHLNRTKRFFLQPSLDYLGHRLDEQGIHPTQEKVRAIYETLQNQRTSQNYVHSSV